MGLNLIRDKWIPVEFNDGRTGTIAPHEIANRDIVSLKWGRVDFNIACVEMLVGMVYLSTPPKDKNDFNKRLKSMTTDELKSALAPYAEAFELMGDGPRFLQELGGLSGKPNPVDGLFIDTAGEQTIKHNKDILFHRNRYSDLSLPEAAMALYTLQDFAPAGGAGNRVSMRGSHGPWVTYLDPQTNLWETIWINTPFGSPSKTSDLPWMKKTKTSENGDTVHQPKGKLPVEVFFSMPRRIKLHGDDEKITGWIQKTYGVKYGDWRHPLSPYGVKKDGYYYPKAINIENSTYSNNAGIFVEAESEEKKKKPKSVVGVCSLIISQWKEHQRGDWDEMSIISAGWSMSNMDPISFVFSRVPVGGIEGENYKKYKGLLDTAKKVWELLKGVIDKEKTAISVINREGEEFYLKTTDAFNDAARAISEGKPYAKDFLEALKTQALMQCDELTRDIIVGLRIDKVKHILTNVGNLETGLRGYGHSGEYIFNALGLPLPEKKKGKQEKQEGPRKMSDAEICLHWWQDNIYPREIKPRAKALSAEIRRLRDGDMYAVEKEPEVRQLRDRLGDVDDETFFLLLSALSVVRDDVPESLALILGSKKEMSETRFQRLLSSSGIELRRAVVRAVGEASKECNVLYLSRDILEWRNRDRASRWLRDFFRSRSK